MTNQTGLNLGECAVQDIWANSARQFSQRPAIDFMGRRWTYGEADALVDRTAAGLQALGVVKGDRVGLCLPNTPYSVFFFFAILKIGGTVVNYNPLYVARELDHLIRDSGTTVIVTIDIEEIYGKLNSVAKAAGVRKMIVCSLGGALPALKSVIYNVMRWNHRVRKLPNDGFHIWFESLIAGGGTLKPAAVDPTNDIAVLQYTGGTTGTPKGAMLTHANVVANCGQIDAVASGLQPGVTPGGERLLAVLPLFHVFAMTCCMNYGFMIGAEVVLLPRFVLRQCIKTLARRKITIFHAVPTIYSAIAKEAPKTRSDLSSIRLCISGGAPLPAEIRQSFERVTGCSLIEGYGLTEASPVVACNPPNTSAREGAVGLPLKDTIIELRDPETGKRITRVAEKGEILVRGPQVMRGYWNKPAETAAVFDDGALCTGDIGYLDADGYLYVVDRIKDVILCGGFNVYPRVIEDALYQHPAVAEAIVIGIPDEYRGQVPKAFVVLRNGMTATPEALQTFLEDYVSKIERPKTIEIRTVLPKTFVGKLSRKELVEEEAGKPGAAAK
ncbi:MAG: long-chain fatty acid--CoA ligase [Beijerinckiaceae bacterium]|jgi:long-chain acyl-CoA synthetase